MTIPTKPHSTNPTSAGAPAPQPRLNVNINTLTADALQDYRTAKGISLTEAVRRLIGIGHFIWKAQLEDKEILLRKGDSTERVIFDF
jgi:hypothetical protein